MAFRVCSGRSTGPVSIISSIIALLLTVAGATPTRAADCDLAQATTKHQQLDDLLDQKFNHYWYGVEHTPGFRTLRFDQITGALPPRTAILFYELSTEIRMVHSSGATDPPMPPRSMCTWLFDGESHIVKVETPLEEADGRAILTLADDVRTSLAGNDDLRGWRAPEKSKLVLATLEASLAPLISPPGVVLARAGQFLLPEAIRQAIRSGAYERLVIVPSRNFGDIPYAALPIDDTQQLIDLVSLVVLPSFTALAPRFLVSAPTAIDRSLVIGDPELKQPDKLARHGMFVPLPGAREEAQQVARVLGVEPLIGGDASQKTLLARITDSDIIYLATHGVANDKDPNDRSYLLLSDGALTARKIAKLRLSRNPIVVMSACQTGLGKTFESGVIGLAKAWKFAGASTVVMSLWSVYDIPTRNLMVEFVTALKNRAPPDVALRSAMRKVKAQYAHPVYWAGFMIYGTPSLGYY